MMAMVMAEKMPEMNQRCWWPVTFDDVGKSVKKK